MDDPVVTCPECVSTAKRMVSDQRSRRLALGTTNRERARAYFSVDTMVARYDALYDQLLEAARAR